MEVPLRSEPLIKPQEIKHIGGGRTYKRESSMVRAFDAMQRLLPTGMVIPYDNVDDTGEVGIIVAREVVPHLKAITESPTMRVLTMVADQNETMPTAPNLMKAGWSDEATVDRLVLHGLIRQADAYEAIATEPPEKGNGTMGIHPSAEKEDAIRFAQMAQKRRDQARELEERGVVPYSKADIDSIIMNTVAREFRPLLVAKT